MNEGRVLVVEDDPEIREVMRELLEYEGYHVLEAPDGAAGLSLLARSQNCLVALVDYRMPYMDGYDLLQEMARDGSELQRHAYVLVTANRDLISPTFENLLASYHIPIVTKPFEIEALITIVAQARQMLRSDEPLAPSASWDAISRAGMAQQ